MFFAISWYREVLGGIEGPGAGGGRVEEFVPLGGGGGSCSSLSASGSCDVVFGGGSGGEGGVSCSTEQPQMLTLSRLNWRRLYFGL